MSVTLEQKTYVFIRCINSFLTYFLVLCLNLSLQELEKKFQQTAAYRNMKEILTRKNDQIKDLRKRLAQ